MTHPFDMNTHLPCSSPYLEGRLSDERHMGAMEMLRCFTSHHPALVKYTQGNNFMLFNTEMPLHEIEHVTREIRATCPEARFTLLIDFRAVDVADRMLGLREVGVDAIKFHCYVQEIEKHEFAAIADFCELAQFHQLPIFVDTSYGSTGLYQYDNLRLAACILKRVEDVPVILLHSGGARIFDAFLLADSCPNAFLDTSFTLDFYMGSSIEQDLAFCYKKLGPGRVSFGSDAPYVPLASARRTIDTFMERHNFPQIDRDAIYHGTAERIFSN